MRILGGNASVASMPSSPARRWAERHAPWILSFCIHLLLLCWVFVGSALPPLRKPETRMVRVHLVDTPEEPPPEPTPPPEPPEQPVFTPARATDSDPEPTAIPTPPNSEPRETAREPEETVAPARQTDVTEQDPPREESDPLDPIAETANQEERIKEILLAYNEHASRNRAERHEDMKDIDKRLEKASIATAASRSFRDYQGARVGAVRTFSDSGVDPEIAKRVKNRYDIHITTRYLDKPGGLSYLSSAASGGSVYHPADKPGYYEVFEISEKAFRQMVVLENEWLVSHGYDPGSTFVDTVEFGIVERSPGYWDLGILNIKVQEYTPLGKPTTTKPMAN
ncbi:hypothetical protein JW916_07135 [Candidatus Sumerlaeota bacterium]|nr:hypothetical protein [Candidatus Sumerlaeota bacterium]